MLLVGLALGCASPPVRSPAPATPPVFAKPVAKPWVGMAFEGTSVRLQTPAPFTTVTLEGVRGDTSVQTGAQAVAVLDLADLPTATFPWREPLGTLRCHRCEPTPLLLPPGVAALLVAARGNLTDMDAWLARYPGAEGQALVQSERATRLEIGRAHV